jgi:CheY-like chemotaxis protein
LIRRETPDLVLLGLNLPSLDGEAILVALHADTATAHIPVVIMTGDALPDTARRLEAAGATVFFVKPIQLAELFPVTRTVGSQRAPARRAREDTQ